MRPIRSKADFISAAYDIKSGIERLRDASDKLSDGMDDLMPFDAETFVESLLPEVPTRKEEA